VRTNCRQRRLLLLPSLAPDDARLLDAKRRKALNVQLDRADPRRRSALLVAILRAMQQVGDTSALLLVDYLADGDTRLDEASPVRAEAKAAASAIRERVAAARTARRLLRPAATPGGDALLRPAGATAGDPGALLRPVGEVPGGGDGVQQRQDQRL
jgi:hypothetical protein